MVVSDLNEGENSFRRLAENLPGIVYRVLIEDDNRTIFFNDMVQTMTGYSPEDLKKGKVYFIDPLILSEDKLNVINVVKDAIENNVLFEVEYRINNKNGELRWFFERGRPIRGDNGNPSYIDGIIFDITKRKETEQKLKESEARYRLMTENANDLIVIVNEDFEFEYINEPTHRRLRHISKKDRIGKSALSIVHPEDLEITMKIIKEGFITGEGKTEVRLINKDGTYDWFEVRGKTFNDTDGNVKVILISRNINEYKLTGEALIKSEKEFRNIFESIPVGLHLYKLNPQGNLIFKGFNLTANKILNTNCEPFISKTIEEAFPQLIKTDIPNRYKSLAKEGGIWGWDQVDYDENQIKGAFEVVAFQTAPNTMVTSFRDITERIELENALRTSEEKYRLLFESIADPIHVVDADLKILYMNPAFERWLKSLGLDSNVVGKTSVEAWPFIGENVNDEYQKVFETKQIDIKEEWMHFKDIDVFTEARKIPILKSGNVVQVITIIRDFSDRKKAEQKLKIEKEKAQKYLDVAGVIIVALNADQKVQLINQKGCEILGEQESQIIGMNWFDNYIPENVREQVKIYFNQILSGDVEPLEYYENAVITKNGKERIISWHNHILKNKAGQIIGTLSSGLDITEEKKRAQHWQTTFDAMSESVFLLDIEQNILQCNKATLDILGKEKSDEIMGHSCCEIVHGTSEPVELCPMIRMIESGNKQVSIAQIRDRWCEISVDPVISDEGILIGAVHIISDITEQREAENALRESEEKFRGFIEQSINGVSIIDECGKIIEWNRGLELITGLNKEDVLEKFIWDIQHQLTPDEIKNQERYLFYKNSIIDALTTGKSSWLGKATDTKFRRSDTKEMRIMQQYPFLIKTRDKINLGNIYYDITDKKKAEEKLKESEEKYRSLFENSPVALMDQDLSEMKKYIDHLKASGIDNFNKFFDEKPNELLKILNKAKIVDVNKKTLEIYKGNNKEDFISRRYTQGKILANNMAEEILLDNKREILALINGDMMYESEISSTTSFGDTLYLYAKTSVTSGYENTWSNVIVSIIDITDQKLMEENLKASEEKYRSFVENFQGIAFQGYEDYSVDFFHGAVKEITGYTPEDFTSGRIKWNQLFIREDISEFQELEFEKNSQTQLEYKIKAKDGTTHWILSKTQKFYDEIKKKRGGRGIFIDITDKKRAEELLKESEEKFRTIAEQSFMGIIIIQDGLFKYFNQRAADMNGYSV